MARKNMGCRRFGGCAIEKLCVRSLETKFITLPFSLASVVVLPFSILVKNSKSGGVTLRLIGQVDSATLPEYGRNTFFVDGIGTYICTYLG